jgi:hypothetical protein
VRHSKIGCQWAAMGHLRRTSAANSFVECPLYLQQCPNFCSGDD